MLMISGQAFVAHMGLSEEMNEAGQNCYPSYPSMRPQYVTHGFPRGRYIRGVLGSTRSQRGGIVLILLLCGKTIGEDASMCVLNKV